VTKWRFIGVLAVLVVLVFLLGSLVVVGLNRTTTQTRTFGGPITKIVATADRGSITITGSPRTDVTVVTRRRFVMTGPDVSYSLSGGVLTISSSCPMMAFISCSANLTIAAPAGTAVVGTAQRGLLAVAGITGTVFSNSESGDFALTGATSSVTAYSLNGRITVRLTRPPQKVHLRSETGNVTLTLPPGDYAIDANTGIGTASITGLTSHPGASQSIYVSSGSGAARVRAGA
jgi:hypothetical protein